MRVGTRLDDLGELVVDTATKEVGTNNDLIVRGKAVQNRCGLLGQVLVSVDIHRERMDVFALAGEQPNALDDSGRKMSMGRNDKLPHLIPFLLNFGIKMPGRMRPGRVLLDQ